MVSEGTPRNARPTVHARPAAEIALPPAKNTSRINAVDYPQQTLLDFELADLAQFTLEGIYSNNASRDFHLFFVGHDNVHEILKYLFSRATNSIYMNMFGYDDDELNEILMQKALDSSITMLITLDKSQAGGVHEKALLDADRKKNLASFNTHFTIGQSLTHQISHTKGFVIDGRVGGEGSTNWSSSGMGTFQNGQWKVMGPSAPAGPVDPGRGFKAQNNTQTVFVDPDAVSRFQSELIAEHLIAEDQQNALRTGGQKTRTPHPSVQGQTGTRK